MKKSAVLRRWVPLGLTFLIMAVLIAYLARSNVLADIDITTLRWQYLVPLLLLQLVFYGLLGLVLATFVSEHGIHLHFREWYGLAVIGTISNIIVPVSGGAMIRAGYLKARYGFSIAHFSAVLAASYLILLAVSGFTGFCLLAVLAWKERTSLPWTNMAIMATLFLGPALLTALPLEHLPFPKENRIFHWILRVLDGWKQIRTAPRLLIWQIGLALALQIVHAVSLQMAFYSLNQPISFFDSFFMSVLANLSTVLRLTPAGIGLTEAATGLGASLLGFHMAQGLAAALIVRLAAWTIAFGTGPLFTFLLSEAALAAPGRADSGNDTTSISN